MVNKCTKFYAKRLSPSENIDETRRGSIFFDSPCRQCHTSTRKLCYRKDDRAMRHMHGCPENLRDSLTTPTATIPNIYQGLLFGSTLWILLQNLKSVALFDPEIIGGTQKFKQSLDTPTFPFLQNFQWAFIRIGPVNVPAKFEVRSFTSSWDKRG